MNLSKVLSVNARKYPNKEALVMGDERVTYSEWDQRVNRLAHHLREKGIQKGDKVVVIAPNSIEFAMVYYAVIRAEGIVVPVNARSTIEEVKYIIQDCEATGIFVHDLLFNQYESLAEEMTGIFFIKSTAYPHWEGLDQWEEVASGELFEPELSEDNEVSIIYTSGTTGKPKGVLFTHRNILTVSTMINIELGLNLDSRVLHLMPLSHSAPLHLFFAAGNNVGATHILAPTFTPDLLLQLTQNEKATHFFGAPVAYLLTLQHPQFSHYDLSSIQYWVYGGSPLSTDMCRKLERVYGKEKLCCVYGLTEAGPSGSCLLHKTESEKAGSIGKRGAWSIEVEIVDHSGRRVQPGEIGELLIRGEGNMKQYYNNKEESQSTLRDEWIYTGDLAKYDEDGYMWVIDRKKDVIISGGVNIYPKEVEQVIEQHPQVKEVAVVGFPHHKWGETPVAYLVVKDQEQEVVGDWTEELKAFLSGKLSDYKIPRIIQVVAELPRNASGKILKHVLRDQVAQK